MKMAYFGFPHLGGTFQVYRQLRLGLQPLGIDVQWVGLGEAAHHAFTDPAWSSERAHGFVVGSPQGREEAWARQHAVALEGAGFDGVFVNVLADAVQTNLARYLPRRMLRVLIVHNITPGTYQAARAVRDHVHATVAISPRIRDDLERWYGFPPDRIVLIPHAAEAPAGPAFVERQTNGPLRLLFLGRIEDQAKGVLSLPRILERLPNDVTLTVAGDGPDLPELKQRCAPFGDRVRFLGSVRHGCIGALLIGHHVMVMPSRYEGFGLSLVEAMAAGCVPVVSQIRGVTDWIVRDGHNGLLFPMDSDAQAAERIARLDGDRALLRRLSAAARATVCLTFEPEAMASGYRTLLERLRDHPPAIAEPLDLADWQLPRGLRSGLRTCLPTPVKNFLRRVKEGVA